jgi:hypothetical protein
MTILSLARKSLLLIFCLVLALAYTASTPVSYAASAKSIEKQARKIEGRLAKLPKGAFLHFHFRDGSEATGKLGNLSDNAFSITNSESNLDESHPYSDVTGFEKGKAFIGKDSAESHHRLRMPF